MYRAVTQLHGEGDTTYIVGESLQRIVRCMVSVAAMLVALGVLIELVDQIRWTIARALEKS